MTTQIDCDPVYGNAESDAGQTSGCGGDPEHYKAVRDVRALWDEVREQWFTTGLTRTALGGYAAGRANMVGWEVNLSGHRLGDFPHEAHYDGSLADADIRPKPNLWLPKMEIPRAGSGRSTRTSCSKTSHSSADARFGPHLSAEGMPGGGPRGIGRGALGAGR